MRILAWTLAFGALAASASAQTQCNALLQPACLEKLGAGAAPAPQSDCAAQLQRYRACLADIAATASPAQTPTEAVCSEARAGRLWADAKASGSCGALDGFRQACPQSPEARFAAAMMAERNCDAPGSEPAQNVLNRTDPAALRPRSEPFSDLGADVAGARAAGDYAQLFEFGWDYESGTDGKPRDYGAAARLYRAACDGDDPRGCANLGFLYEKGAGVSQDVAQAAELYRRACDGGNAVGCTNLGWMYENGQGAVKNAASAADFYRRGCEAGNARGCTNLGFLYEKGRGVAEDDGRAAQLYAQSCDGGYALACNNLGVMHEFGEGVPKDRQRAAELYRQALTLDPQVQFAAGNLKRLGEAP